jgi:hypothetical protein
MFISRTEKLAMQEAISDLSKRLARLEGDANLQLVMAMTSEDAPHGLKKDGTPKKRPGRASKTEGARP